LNDTGIGGLIIHFRLGAMPYSLAARSIQLFAEKVAPNFSNQSIGSSPYSPDKI